MNRVCLVLLFALLPGLSLAAYETHHYQITIIPKDSSSENSYSYSHETLKTEGNHATVEYGPSSSNQQVIKFRCKTYSISKQCRFESKVTVTRDKDKKSCVYDFKGRAYHLPKGWRWGIEHKSVSADNECNVANFKPGQQKFSSILEPKW